MKKSRAGREQAPLDLQVELELVRHLECGFIIGKRFAAHAGGNYLDGICLWPMTERLRMRG